MDTENTFKMVISNSTSFHYLILSLSEKARQLECIINFENCIAEYNGLCGCEPEVKNMKINECEFHYRDIILNHLDEVKDYFLEVNDSYDFESIHPEYCFLTSISKNN